MKTGTGETLSSKGYAAPDLAEKANDAIRRYSEANKNRERRKLFGVRVYEKYGDADCRRLSLCQQCIDKFEPPARVVHEGQSGTRGCDHCDALNIL